VSSVRVRRYQSRKILPKPRIRRAIAHFQLSQARVNSGLMFWTSSENALP
jgi:hypothetical protein